MIEKTMIELTFSDPDRHGAKSPRVLIDVAQISLVLETENGTILHPHNGVEVRVLETYDEVIRLIENAIAQTV